MLKINGTVSRAPVRRRQSGFSLIEAMVAFVILAVSIMAFTRIQVGLRLNTEVSKQRSEAVRLAQERIEEFRGFNALAVGDLTTAQKTVTTEVAYASIAVGTTADGTITSGNTDFTRSITVVESTTTPSYKSAVVTVSWVDRAGSAQNVVLTSVVAGIAPALLAQTNNAPAGGTQSTMSPMRRNPKIPVSAVDLGNGKSGFIPPGDNTKYFVMDNLDASIFQQCTLSAPTTTLTKAEYDAHGSSNCVTAPGYFLAGSISYDLNNSISLLESGGHRPADPPTSVCSFYTDAQGKGLINGTVATIAQAYDAIVAAVSDVVYYAMAVTIGSSTPSNGSSCVATNATYSVAMTTDKASASKKLTGVSISSAATATIAGVPVGGSWSASITDAKTGSATITFTPASALPSSSTISISIPANAITFTGGWTGGTDTNSAAVSVNFSTGGTAPILTSFIPANGGTVSDVSSNFTLTFDQAMAKGSGLIKLFRVKNGTDTQVESFNLPSASNVSISGNTVTIDPVAALTEGETYYLTIESGALKAATTCATPYAGFSATDTMRFSTASTGGGSCPSAPLAFVGLTIPSLSTANPSGGTHQCYSDSLTVVKDNNQKYVSYFCVVLHEGSATANFSWSGSLKVAGPASWLSTSNYKVCRYTDPNGNGTVTQDEHPDPYSGVTASLTDQNFLVIKAAETCPSQILDVTKDISIYFKTLQHQP